MQGIDEERVGRWLDANVAGVHGPFRFDVVAGGRSNLTYRVTAGDGAVFVMRRPPLGHVLATAHDMAREFRIISALGPTSVPVPRALALCTDDEVNGMPFYIMSWVEGVVLDSPEKAGRLRSGGRVGVAHHLVDVLADLHSLDVDELGLGDLARRDGYVERQLKRWSAQWASSKTRELQSIEEVERRLRAAAPEQRGVAVAHGDFRFGNCLIDVDKARVAAVLDWELCTLGDPLADLGYLGVYWCDPGTNPQGRANDPTSAGGFPAYTDIVERYATRTGRDVSGIGYYVAFSCWRLAVISEGVYARYLHGAMGHNDVDVSLLGQATVELADRALASLSAAEGIS